MFVLISSVRLLFLVILTSHFIMFLMMIESLVFEFNLIMILYQYISIVNGGLILQSVNIPILQLSFANFLPVIFYIKFSHSSTYSCFQLDLVHFLVVHPYQFFVGVDLLFLYNYSYVVNWFTKYLFHLSIKLYSRNVTLQFTNFEDAQALDDNLVLLSVFGVAYYVIVFIVNVEGFDKFSI